PASTGPATSCSGSPPTPRWCSWTRSGPTSTAGTCGRPARSTPPASAVSARPSSRSPGAAVGAGAEDLQRVADVGEPVLAGHPVGPLLHRGAGHLHGQPAAAAHQVVVVLPAAAAVERLAGVGAQGVELAVVGQRLDGAVDRGQPDRVTR